MGHQSSQRIDIATPKLDHRDVLIGKLLSSLPVAADANRFYHDRPGRVLYHLPNEGTPRRTFFRPDRHEWILRLHRLQQRPPAGEIGGIK